MLAFATNEPVWFIAPKLMREASSRFFNGKMVGAEMVSWGVRVRVEVVRHCNESGHVTEWVDCSKPKED